MSSPEGIGLGTVVSRSPGVLGEPSGDRTILLDAEGTTVFTLSRVGAVIWEELSESPTVHALVRALSSRFPDVGEDVIGVDVQEFVTSLADAGLVELSS